MGLTWPQGSSIQYFPSIGRLSVTTTPENVSLLERILAEEDALNLQVEIELQYVQFDQDLVSSFAKRNATNCSPILDLWKSGKGELLMAPCIFTRSGVEAVIQAKPGEIGQSVFGDPQSVTRQQKIATSFVQVLPEIAPEGNRININLVSEMLQTQISVMHDRSVLIGGGYPGTKKGKLLYFILTARVMHVDGHKMGTNPER